MAANTIIDKQSELRLLRLFQLASPALPVGAFAYSQGMEWAVHAGWLASADDVARWLKGLLVEGIAWLDVPVFTRLYRAWEAEDKESFQYWNDFLLASRGTAELLQEDRLMGRALARLLVGLGVIEAHQVPAPYCAFSAMFAAAAVSWEIAEVPAAAAFIWSWAQNQVAVAVKLVPLGQTDGQGILLNLGETITWSLEAGLGRTDDAIGAALPGFCMASARHETQHTRLFRS